MFRSDYLYLGVLLFSIFIPLLRSFERRIYFIGKWKRIVFSIGVMSIIFIPWDILFTKRLIWGFNEEYNLNIALFSLPLEEILFFIFVPFSCLFINEVAQYFNVYKRLEGKSSRYLTLFLIVFLISMIVISTGLSYTFWVSIYTLIVLLLGQLMLKKQMSKFYSWFGICLIPFIAVNSILTGYFTPEPVVWYNSNEILGIRFGTIPIEDFIYNLGMLMTVYLPYTLLWKKGSDSIQNVND